MAYENETIHTIHEFSEFLKNDPKKKLEFEKNPIEFLSTLSMPAGTKSAIADMSYFIYDVLNRKDNSNTKLTTPLDLNDGEIDRDENSKVVFTEPPRLRSITRKDCRFVVVGRRTVETTVIDASALDVLVIPDEVTTTVELKSHLEWALRAGVSAELSAAVTSGAFSASTTANMSAETVRQHVETFLQTSTLRFVHYRIIFSGPLYVRTHLSITQDWAWDGKDCDTPIPPAESLTHTVIGDPTSVMISTTFHIYDFFTESEGIQVKEQDAINKAKAELQLKLQHTKALPEPPFPTDAIYPLNFSSS
ncbi:hypothetical protein [Nitrosopumilus sp.]|uniref:hypothetical protein n=1 Tax=Nitrosopumilus sp. TaxID=2024843 RepID=UPI002606292C|nr:hypothetical protein [Nitrosopumilus sp.]